MRRVLIGHRGSGKTSLLLRHQTYFPDVKHFDLDQELEIKYKSSIEDFFKNQGEEKFRLAEVATYHEITAQHSNYVISLGAGFRTDFINEKDEVIFVSRNSDSEGRIFLNRPRLDQTVNPLVEFKINYKKRDPLFRKRADFIYHLSEGKSDNQAVEKEILTFNFEINDAYATLSSKDISHISRLIKNFKKIELRTDLLSKNEILDLLKKYPQINWMASFRTSDFFEIESQEIDIDVRFYKNQKCSIISTHENNIDRALAEIKTYQDQFHIKLCPQVDSFSDLMKGHQWQQQNPSDRSFLPRSQNGRWNWYRQLLKYQQKINFIRFFNEIDDQPTLFQWLNLPYKKPQNWAAVLGTPILFSRSPVQHQSFFKQRNTFMSAIEMNIEEFHKYLNWLIKLGLDKAAVTSPLKEAAFQIGLQSTEEAQKLRSANTFLLKDEKLTTHNTDLAGFAKLTHEISHHQNDIAVWGGGGTLAMIKSVLPRATYFSSQTGFERDTQKASPRSDFKILIWAAPRRPNTLFPSDMWPIESIYDINYFENSMGLEYAQNLKLNGKNVVYKSGLEMFFEQATKQQDFWSSQ